VPDDRTVHGVEIRLENVTKHYPGSQKAAVDGIDLTIGAGEVVVLVGPSGCGKTTTMRMINRLIEPTSGRIRIDGDDALRLDPNRLRRGIGYVIQQGGLFPHQTIADNIAVVPRLLKWDKGRIADRVDELLELVGLDAASFRDRYPRQLSGGQQQRVGVARALAADPPVLLMDEPFGAVDPITRARLQDELLRIQEELRKTIVFVTHDFDEAVKLGDRIAILQEGSRIAQYASPEEILTAPAGEFVEDFVGSGAHLKRLNLTRVREVPLQPVVTVRRTEPVQRAQEALAADDVHFVLVVDERDRPLRWVDSNDVRSGRDLALIGTAADNTVSAQATLNDALDTMLASSNGTATVVGRRDEVLGVVTVETVMEAIQTMRAEGVERDRARKRREAAGVSVAAAADGDGR
jgi:osmoprotectant transport system ATP-binding protein